MPCQRPLLAAALLLALAGCERETAPAPQGTVAAATGDAAPAPAGAPPAIPTFASPKEELLASLDRFRAARSFHARMRMEGGPQGAVTTEMDFVQPDRYRMVMRGSGFEMENVRIGNDMYLVRDGQVQKMAVPAGSMEQWQDVMARSQDTMTVEALGGETLDGRAARRFLVHQAEPAPSDVTLWVDEAGLPLQAEVHDTVDGRKVTTTIRYSRIDDPTIRVEAPAG